MTTEITDTSAADFASVLTLPAGGRLSVSATRGTQVIGNRTGDPLDATDFGKLTLTLHGADGRSATVVITDIDTAHQVIMNIGLGRNVADSRDHADDTFPAVGA